MSEEPKRGRRERDLVVADAVERCIAHMRKKSNGEWFPYEVIEALSGIKRYESPKIYNSKWLNLVKKLKRGVRKLPQENLAEDDRGSFNLKVEHDTGFRILPHEKQLGQTCKNMNDRVKNLASRTENEIGAIHQAELSDHANHIRIGYLQKIDNIKKTADDNKKFLAVMWKKSE